MLNEKNDIICVVFSLLINGNNGVIKLQLYKLTYLNNNIIIRTFS